MSAGTINGFGTMWVESKDGGTEFRAATLWGVALFLPILPLKKVVLEPVGDDKEDAFESSRSYFVHERLRVNLVECMFTVLWRWLIFAPAKFVQVFWLPALVIYFGVQSGFMLNPIEADASTLKEASRWWHGPAFLIPLLIGFGIAEPAIGLLTRFEKSVLSIFDPLRADDVDSPLNLSEAGTQEYA